ncbi:MYND finger domain containing protein [Acanthamoeba castellanii str. Neff]|uniref:MYND finger domain containing protein n=1 Tax=Acanthamoeba castellanii (strain ATCC 30010 / Neff) TaxID=1257118 RepID=L8HDL8_ACACF|nr:MYND finger domain containing protein [Acanthamoeba castellanii str. Neff]ELR23589.1 MYND finger domain containing protein [Acanthamoeba castellanii str. Neff]
MSTSGKGKTLLFEHLPYIRFGGSIQGVLFLVFANGEAYFYPLNDKTKGDSPNSAKMITLEQSGRKFVRQADARSDASKPARGNDKYFVYDVALNLSPEFKVFTFAFPHGKGSAASSSSSSSGGKGAGKAGGRGASSDLARQPPRKILLSPNKRLLLMHGALHKGQNSLLVYQIMEDTPPYFRLIFYDMSFTFLDACFSPDSKSLVTIPSRYPCFIFLLNLNFVLGRVRNQHASSSAAAQARATTEATQGNGTIDIASSFAFDAAAESDTVTMKKISFDPRVVGPLAIIGPATGAFDQPLKMAHISSSNNIRAAPVNPKPFHFVTWNDEGTGEYCLWTIIANRKEKETIQFEWYPRLLYPKIRDSAWLEDSHTPKNFILDIQFSTKEGGKLLILLRRENYGKPSLNGIGIQMVKLSSKRPMGEEPADKLTKKICWYQCTESLDRKDVLALKWTNTLLLGNNNSGAIVIEGKGLFELVDYYFASSFQTLYDEFVHNVCNFIQVGRYHRFWTDVDGKLNVMVVTPQQTSIHPEWRELFDQSSQAIQQQFLNMRHLGRRIGYFITDIRKEDTGDDLEKIHARERGTKGKAIVDKPGTTGNGEEAASSSGSGNIDAFFGMHLYRCWNCKRTLLKPLQCSRCQSVVYCSRTCQRDDWAKHKVACDQTCPTYKVVK